ncbi:transporter [Sphingomonas bacterium]|uniref:transporter n=1 Tax=Sphingomonas bacterium TaxID=1895847 RepID=UPI001575BB67|nr:transporter [Sphingomonas bacterium]
MRRMVAAVLLAGAAIPAHAQDLRDFCGDRPGLGTPACTVDKGHLQIELGLGDWTLDKQPDSRTDTILLGDLIARYGIGESTELRFGWTAYGHVRERDRMTGGIDHAGRVGDISVGIKQNLLNPDGDKVSIALLPMAKIPIGRQPVGAGTWSAGLLVPVDYEVSKGVQFQLTPEVDAAADESGHGRHLAYSAVAGIDIDLTETVDLDLELEAIRDREPGQHQTMALAASSIGYKIGKQTQLDAGANAGLNHNTPDAELYFGVSRKF